MAPPAKAWTIVFYHQAILEKHITAFLLCIFTGPPGGSGPSSSWLHVDKALITNNRQAGESNTASSRQVQIETQVVVKWVQVMHQIQNIFLGLEKYIMRLKWLKIIPTMTFRNQLIP